MPTNNLRQPSFGAYAYGLGIAAIGIVNAVLGDFDPTQPVPDTFPMRLSLVYLSSLFLILAGAAMFWTKSARWAAESLAVYYAVIVTLIMNGATVVDSIEVYGAYFGIAEGIALAAAGLICYAALAPLETSPALRITRGCQIAFGLCALFFGGAHFVYPEFTIPLVPAWLPPSQIFWADATGVFHIAGGLAILTGFRAKVGAALLTIMYASFSVLVHIPLVISDPTKHFYWTENALNLALIGVAWVVTDSIRRKAPALPS